MRIGILTLPLHTNYGGILQAYALQTVLERQTGNRKDDHGPHGSDKVRRFSEDPGKRSSDIERLDGRNIKTCEMLQQ